MLVFSFQIAWHLTIGLQIVTFLQQNAHPRVAERIPSVPENVTDQVGVALVNSLIFVKPMVSPIMETKNVYMFSHLTVLSNLCSVPDLFHLLFFPCQIRLWESDLNRVDITPAHFYDEFPSRVRISNVASFNFEDYLYIHLKKPLEKEFLWHSRKFSRLLAIMHESGMGCYGRIQKTCDW